MRQVGILPNMEKDKDFSVTKRLTAHLLSRGCKVLLPEQVANNAGLSSQAVSETEMIAASDFLISLGGDGTLLGAARKAAKYHTPILGINLGNLGFLTAEEKNYAERAIDRVLAGNYILEKRMMLETAITQDQGRETGILALNDICITRGSLYKILEFNLFINNEYVDTLRADGIIICTPTGSTAYNLSAGGPVIKSDAQIIAVTPISAHTLTSRPIVVSADDVVTVEANPREDTIYTVTADGQEAWDMKGKHVIQVKRSEYDTTIIKTAHQSFYDVLRQKLAR